MTAIFLGFIIASAIGLTGVGGGVITTPLLILVLRLKGAVAVGTALTFAAIIKFLVAPMYLFRRQVDFKILAFMCLGGVPGVIVGGLFLNKLSKSVDQHLIYLVLGITIVIASALNIYRLLRTKGMAGTGNSPRWLAALMLPVGAEVGFSSAGSGALGSLALLGLTKLDAAQVVGTDICFGLVLSVIGSGIQIFAGNYNGLILEQLLIGGVFGSFVGGFLALKIPSRPLKWALAVWLAGLGIQIFMRGLA
jgi:uncharacterized membrane protein YfcA